jgi:hypothetical protein
MEKENIMDMDIFVQEEARKRIEQDINERIAVHKANIVRLATAQASATTLGVAVRNRPLILLAQGDSWFDYPLTGNGLPLVDTDVVAQLRRIGPMPPIILKLAQAASSKQRGLEWARDRCFCPPQITDGDLLWFAVSRNPNWSLSS